MKKPKKKEKIIEDTFVSEADTEDPILTEDESSKQKKIRLAQGEFAPVIIELLKDIMQQPELIGKDMFETAKNAIILDTQATILKEMVDYLEEIRKGVLHDKK